jgi:hypothetical protein
LEENESDSEKKSGIYWSRRRVQYSILESEAKFLIAEHPQILEEFVHSQELKECFFFLFGVSCGQID